MDDIVHELMTPDGEQPMRADQVRGIRRILTGMGFSSDGPEVDDLMVRLGVSRDAWRYRMLTVAQANTMLEILARFYESKTRPTVVA